MRVSTHLIGKIKRYVQVVKGDMDLILTAHESKAKLNHAIVEKIKKRGNRYSLEFEQDKKRMLEIITKQESDLRIVLADLERIDHLLELIINTEQISILIDQRKRYGGVSALVDPIAAPLENFQSEIDDVKVIRDGFQVLKIELEKQKEYVKHFDLEPDDVDEEYFRKSQEYEAALSNQEMVSLSHLSNFCLALEHQLTGRLKSDRKIGSDDVTKRMLDTLSRVKFAGFFSPSIRGFLDRYVRDVIGEKAFARTFVLSFVFILSRLEYFEKEQYHRTIKLARLAYRTASAAGFGADQRDAIVLAALASRIEMFDTMPQEIESIDGSERSVLSRYYHLVNSTFITKIPFLETIRQEAAKPTSTQTVTWPQQAGRFLGALDRSLDVIAEHGESEKKVAHVFTRTMKINDGTAIARAVIETLRSLDDTFKSESHIKSRNR